MNNILYISLTGMTEPLGRSQVLEYLIELSKKNKIYLISFEREYDLDTIVDIQNIVSLYDINWDYLIYSNKQVIFLLHEIIEYISTLSRPSIFQIYTRTQ